MDKLKIAPKLEIEISPRDRIQNVLEEEKEFERNDNSMLEIKLFNNKSENYKYFDFEDAVNNSEFSSIKDVDYKELNRTILNDRT